MAICATIAQPQQAYIWTLLPTLITVTVGVLVAWLAHFFSVRREREKRIMEMMERAEKQIESTCVAAISAWEAMPSERSPKLVELMWRLDQLGHTIELMRQMSERWMSWSNEKHCLRCVNDQAKFRVALTGDPDEIASEVRSAMSNKRAVVESARGDYVAALQREWLKWVEAII